MATRSIPWPEGRPCWVDLAVDDFAEGQAFYGDLFGWHIPVGLPELGGYSTCTKDGRAVAGLSPKMALEQPSVWTTYLAADNVDATAAVIADNGGQVVAEPLAISQLGRMAVAMDPAGAVVGLWQSGTHTGFEVVEEPGSVTWNENLSRDWKRNQEFYTAILGYEYDDMSGNGLEYAVFRLDGSVAKDPWDSAFGRMAAVVDNQGAAFMLMADVQQA